jgi:hypothetical protein
MPDEEYARLVEVNWTALPYNEFDAIQSLLVDHPGWYYIPPSRQWLCYLTRDHGLLKLVNDFSMMEDEQIDEYITGVLEMLYS